MSDRVRVVLLAMMMVGAIRLASAIAFRTLGVDVLVYRASGRAVLEGHSLYELSVGSLALPFTYPPFAAILFIPLAGIPDVILWPASALLNYFTLAMAVGITAQRLGLKLPARDLAVFSIALTCIAPVAHTVELGQIDILIMLAILTDALILPPRYRGILTGICAGVKLTPAIFGLYYLLTKQFPAALRATLCGIASLALGWLAFPRDSATFWLNKLWDTNRPGSLDFSDNVSLNGTLHRVFNGHPNQLVSFLAVAAVGLLFVYAAWREAQRENELKCLLTVALLGTTVSPLAWDHHWCWIAVIIASYILTSSTTSTVASTMLFAIVPSRTPVPISWLLGIVYPFFGVLWTWTDRTMEDRI